VLPLFGLVACSLLYDVTGVQCTETEDCEGKGAAFAGTVCENSVCVTPSPPDGTGGAGGEGGNGSGGGSSECTTNGECIDAHFDQAMVCRKGTCIPLELPQQCPFVLGVGDDDFENLRQPEPIIIGIYAPFESGVRTKNGYVMNYELAIDEMNQGSGGGLDGGPGGSSRPFIGVVCQGVNDADLGLSMGHLIDDLEVPAIVSALYADDLKRTFNMYGHPSEVFFLSPLDGDSNLTAIQDDGLLWHMMPGGKAIAPGYLALVPLIEEWIHGERSLPEGDPIRLALVSADDQYLDDIKDPVIDGLTFNGGLDVFDNEDNGHYRQLQTDSTTTVPQPDISDTKDALLDFKPHVILSIGSRESLTLINSLEQEWTPALGPKPFYVISPYAYGAPELTDPTQPLVQAHQRMLGVLNAGAEDTTLYQKLLNDLEDAYPQAEGYAGKENFYDAAYFVMYAIAAAGNPARLTGDQVAVGMTRLINPTGNTPMFDVGTTDIPYALGQLTFSKIGLVGALGQPDFDAGAGVRNGVPSIYCVDGDLNKIQDALRYDPDTGSISGTQSCVPNFPP
jgi:hypothetical protein